MKLVGAGRVAAVAEAGAGSMVAHRHHADEDDTHRAIPNGLVPGLHGKGEEVGEVYIVDIMFETGSLIPGHCISVTLLPLCPLCVKDGSRRGSA